jgi:hypothetical protein
MFYLVDEMFKQRNKRIHLSFGTPISYALFDNSKTKKEWTDLVRKEVYKLGKK